MKIRFALNSSLQFFRVMHMNSSCDFQENLYCKIPDQCASYMQMFLFVIYQESVKRVTVRTLSALVQLSHTAQLH